MMSTHMPHTLTNTRIAAMFAVLVGIAPDVSAQMFVATGRDTLRGLPGVEVAVEPLERDLEGDGLTPVAIHSDVERRLRAGGIMVYTSQTENPSEAKAYLYVLVNSLKVPGQDFYVIGVQVQLRQTLRSLVTASNIVDAMTWDAHDVLVVRIGQVTSVRESIQRYVDQFIRDWTAVHR
jgi:plasmid stabilization system protein ParE